MPDGSHQTRGPPATYKKPEEMCRSEKTDLRIRKPFGDTGQNIEWANSARAKLQKRDRREERDERNDDAHFIGLSETGCDQLGTACEEWVAVSDIGVTV